ncbi:MAG: hypothetical protein V4735_01990 [Pseudomonadota bacterium]
MKYRTTTACLMVTLLTTTSFALPASAYDRDDNAGYRQIDANVQPGFGSPQVMESGAITYVSGGVGEGNQATMEEMKSSFNFHLLSASKSGAFMGDTYIVISDAKTQDVLLNVASGPLFYANLPKGRYVIDVSSSGQSQQKTITVGSKKSIDLRFTWKDDTTDMQAY